MNEHYELPWWVFCYKWLMPTVGAFVWLAQEIGNIENIQFITHLNSRFRQIDFECSFLTHKNVRITCSTEQRLQDVELGPSKCRSFTSLFTLICCKNKHHHFFKEKSKLHANLWNSWRIFVSNNKATQRLAKEPEKKDSNFKSIFESRRSVSISNCN